MRTSLPSIKRGSKPPLEKALAQRDEGPSSTTAAVLEAQLQQERVERRHERYYLTLALLVSIACILIKFMGDGWLASFVIFALALILAIGLAHHWKVTPVIRPLEQLWARVIGWKKPEGEEEKN